MNNIMQLELRLKV